MPPPPRTPSERARQIVFAYGGAQKAMLIIGVVFTLVGLCLGGLFGITVPFELQLDFGGPGQAVGVVQSAELDRSSRINGRHPTTITYAFELDGGRLEGSSTTIDERLQRLERGARVPIEYVAGSPSISRVKGTTYGFFGYFGLFPLIFALIGLPMALLARRANQREIRAFTHGEATLGNLLSFELNRSVRVNRRHPWELRWEFFVDDRRFTGELSSLEPGLLDPFAVERPVVLFDPKDPAVNTLWIP